MIDWVGRMCVAWLIEWDVCCMIHLNWMICVLRDSFIYVCVALFSDRVAWFIWWYVCCVTRFNWMICVLRDSYSDVCVALFIRSAVTHSVRVTRVLHDSMCTMTESFACRDSFVYRDSIVCVPWLFLFVWYMCCTTLCVYVDTNDTHTNKSLHIRMRHIQSKSGSYVAEIYLYVWHLCLRTRIESVYVHA